jgi:tRNA(fMet)-specific endonuclease VapC
LTAIARLYRLNTDIISDLIMNPAGKAVQRVASVGDKAVCTSIIAAGELMISGFHRAYRALRR